MIIVMMGRHLPVSVTTMPGGGVIGMGRGSGIISTSNGGCGRGEEWGNNAQSRKSRP
jgi:hypothetical protein